SGSGGAAPAASRPGATGSYAAGPVAAPTLGAAPAGSAGRSSLDLGPATPPESSGTATPESLECPNCEAPNPPGALFCEACGYDFTTGAMPRVAGGGEDAAATAGAEAAGAGTDTAADAKAADPAPGSSAPEGPPASASSAHQAPSDTAFEWLAEVWVDPDWYQTQEVEDPCPSPGLPIIIPIRARSVLLGRVSQSRNTHPEIDLSSDPGVSRRHAQLTTDGVRWFVEDLGSSNGTFVGPASGRLPDDPIAVGPKTELGDDDRLYVGAWSRVVVRRATPDEVEAYA
ncbi:FHA domain-containing protein, partial [Intrasporangium sp.]|uniref:FHA domain-containing protein n=1 Tax=Intrasporangium sp. TaxID=1925024 RepID=UPI00293B129F